MTQVNAEHLNKITQGDSLEVLRELADNSIDLTVTSPPYDNLRTYNGFTWDFEGIARELYRVTKDGGVVVWVVGDATVKGSETGTSFIQALFFKEIGFNLHDTMIYEKYNPFGSSGKGHLRYRQGFEYMFVLSKGKVLTFNPLTEDCVKAGKKINATTRKNRQSDGGEFDDKRAISVVTKPTKVRKNIFCYHSGFNHTTKDKYAFEHSAMFPEQLANDHITTWSNPGDVVLDPFGGSGTTAKMAILNNRDFIHIDISGEYVAIANQRIADALQK